MKYECPVECSCGSVYDGSEWNSCPHCEIHWLKARILDLELAIAVAIDFMGDEAPLHALNALSIVKSRRPTPSNTDLEKSHFKKMNLGRLELQLWGITSKVM